jgi:hypothetical protein
MTSVFLQKTWPEGIHKSWIGEGNEGDQHVISFLASLARWLKSISVGMSISQDVQELGSMSSYFQAVLEIGALLLCLQSPAP